MVLEITKIVDSYVINRVKSVNISFVRAYDFLLLDDDGVQFILDSFYLIFDEKEGTFRAA